MSITKRIAFAAGASWFSRGISILVGLVLIPVLFRNLQKEELGVWLLLAQSAAMLGIFDLGFGATLTRRIAFAKGESDASNRPGAYEKQEEIATLLATGHRIYALISILSFAASFGAGALYLRSLTLQQLDLGTACTAWGILCLSQALLFWGMPWSCLLQGIGYVGWDSVVASFVTVVVVFAQMISVMAFQCGLVTLATIAALGALLQRLLLIGFGKRRRPDLFALKGTWSWSLFRGMFPLALKAWLTAVGLTLVLNSDQVLVAALGGAARLPSYRAAYVVLLNINMLSVTLASASVVFISQLWQSGRLHDVHRIVTRNLRMGLIVMAGGGSFVLGLGPAFFDVWVGPGNFIGYPILIVFFALQFLEAQSFIIAAASRATEDEVFAPWALTSGLLKVALAFALGRRFGLVGIALATLIAQLVTNHWFMVYRGLRRLKLGLKWYVSEILFPVFTTLITVLFVTRVIRSIFGESVSWTQILLASGACLALTILAVWLFAIDRNERRSAIGLLPFLLKRSRVSEGTPPL